MTSRKSESTDFNIHVPQNKVKYSHMKLKKLSRILCAAQISLFCMIPAAVNIKAQEPDPSLYEGLGSDYIFVYDSESGQVLCEKNPDERMYPASMTKIMTVLVAIEHLDNPDETVEITEEVTAGLIEANASIAGYAPGDTVTVRDLLYGSALPSGADASNALAYRCAGSMEGFIDMMNAKAAEIGMTSTHFANSTGLHDDNHYSTARDIATLLAYAIQNETFAQIFSAKEYTSSPTQWYPDGIEMESTTWSAAERLGTDLPDLIGSKTGFTYEAGHCLAYWAEFNGMKIVGVNAHCDEDDIYSAGHITETSVMLERLHDYEKTVIVEEGQVLDTLTIHYSDHDETVDITSDRSIVLDMRKGNEPVITSTLADEASAGLNDGEVTGVIRIEKDGQLMFEEGIRVTVPKEVKFWARVKMRWNSIFHKNSGN